MDKVLTKEIFREKVKYAILSDNFNKWRYSNYDLAVMVDFEGYIVFASAIDYKVAFNNGFPINLDLCFRNCKIESMVYLFNNISFINCRIVDYKKIHNIVFSQIINCEFEKPVPLACPTGGEFVAYKKCAVYHDNGDKDNYCVVKLLIPEYAKRSSAFTNKCRCSEAYVLELLDLDGNPLQHNEEAVSMFFDEGKEIVYKKGCEVRADWFDENRYNECSGGIHFFMTFEEAGMYW